MRNRVLFLLNMTLLLACLSVRAAEPSVSISTSFAKNADKAVTCKCTTNGSFTASTENAPTGHAEAIVTGPVYAWTISPTNHVTFTPTNAATVDLSLLNSNAFGKTYGVSVVVTWFKSNTVTHTVTPIQATTNMTLAAIKVELEKCNSAFQPKGGDEDNTVQIIATVTPASITGKFKFTLCEVSQEPGYCLNMPNPAPSSGEDSASWKDLQFLSEQSGFTVSGANKDVAETTADNLPNASVMVKSFDYGSYGRIKVLFTMQNGVLTCMGTEKGGTKEYTNIPLDDDENHIWDGWAYNAGAALDDTDKNTDGNCCGQAGDGLSRYEEWRGFIFNPSGKHQRLNPEIKETFVYNTKNLLYGIYGANSFESIAKIKVIPVLPSIYATGRVINFNHDTAHVVDQHVFELDTAYLGGSWCWGRNTGAGKTPEEGGTPKVDPDQVAYDCKYRVEEFIANTVTHELCHGIGGVHSTYGVNGEHPLGYDYPVCVMRLLREDCKAAGSSKTAWDAILIGKTWHCIYHQMVSDVY